MVFGGGAFWYGAKDRIWRYGSNTAGMVMAQWTAEAAARPIGCSIFESALKARDRLSPQISILAMAKVLSHSGAKLG